MGKRGHLEGVNRGFVIDSMCHVTKRVEVWRVPI